MCGEALVNAGPIPIISIRVSTWNQAPFIAQALESILMQDFGGLYEVIVGDDASTDETASIVESYAPRFAGRLHLLRGTVRQGMRANFDRTLAACRGQYVAVLDGDDFWTDPRKLAAQVQMLETHPEWVGCYHNVWVLDQSTGTQRAQFSQPPKLVLTIEDLLVRNTMPHSSMVFRNPGFDGFPPGFTSLPMSDWPMNVLLAQRGGFAYLDAICGTYRIHAGGAWSRGVGYSAAKALRDTRTNLAAYRVFDRHFEGRYHDLLSPVMGACRRRLIQLWRQRISEAIRRALGAR